MSLSTILNIANSGLQTSQTQLRVVSDNVANVNTPGYVRKIADQVSISTEGVGTGVNIARIRIATDRFLQAAALNAGAEASREGVRYELYDRIQSLFGDPGGDSSFFSQIDSVFSAFAVAAEDAVSAPRRQEALFKTQAIFDEAARITQQIQAVREDADTRISTAVDKANSLLKQIELLNVSIAKATVTTGDASGALTQQAQLVDQLAKLMDVQVQPRAIGGITIRTGDGVMLAGAGTATLEYKRAGAVTSESTFNEIWITEPGGNKRNLADGLKSGEIKGLLELRDVDAPQTAERVAELVAHVADELNRAHNANSGVPAPNSLTGKNVGQTLETALTGFTGETSIAVVNPTTGAITTRVDVAFSGGSVSFNGGPPTPMANFLVGLNTALGGAATASFVDGKLSITAAGGAGVAIADPVGAASDKAGRGFSHYFGMNDLVVSGRPSTYDIGLTLGSQLGFTPGETVTFRLTGENGAKLRDVAVAVPAGGTLNDLLNALNNSVTGVGRYGSFALDAASGEVKFTPLGSPAPRMSVIEDKTTQVPSGQSVTELLGLGKGVRASRGDDFSVRLDIRQNPAKLALAQLNLTAAAGTPALTTGDGRGALVLADAGQKATRFSSAGASPGGSMSVSRYASELSGEIGGKANAAKTRQASAQALATEAETRQQNFEGVNLDEELVLMTTYQQAFNASARMIQAAKDMYDMLLGMI